MSKITPPRVGIPIGLVIVNGQTMEVQTHPEFVRFFESLWLRVGGVSGPSNNELALSQFEDAGIEEIKAGVSRANDAALQLPIVQLAIADSEQTDLSALREELAALRSAVQALQQGATA